MVRILGRRSIYSWWEAQGVKKENLFPPLLSQMMNAAFYSAATSRVLNTNTPSPLPNSSGELEGVAYRTDYDLKQHQEHSAAKSRIHRSGKQPPLYPACHRTSKSGLSRGVLGAVVQKPINLTKPENLARMAQTKTKPRPSKTRHLPTLVNKDGMPEIAEKLYLDLRQSYICQYDAKQSIGKRYARMDECGTPFCITIDGETAKDQAVTIRHRDTAQQERIALDKVKSYLARKFSE